MRNAHAVLVTPMGMARLSMNKESVPMLLQDRTGVYLIRNTIDETIYVGSTTKSFRVRRQAHFSSLRNGKHNNPHLQSAFKKYGESVFDFVILEVVEGTENILAREQYWMDWYRAQGRVYNVLPRAGTTKGQPWHFKTLEEREKLSKALRGRKQDPEVVAKRNLYWTPEARAAQSARKKGIKFKDTTKMSEARRGNKNARACVRKCESGFIAPDGTHYASIENLADFCKEHGLRHDRMYNVYNGKSPQHKGWRKG